MSTMADTNPYKDRPEVTRVLQWTLEDILTHHKQPSQEDLAIIPPGTAMEIIQSLAESLQDGNEIAQERTKKAFAALCKTYPWLGLLKNKTVPPRPGTESEQASSEDEDERITTGKQGKKVFRTLSMSEIKKLPRAQWQVPGIYQKVSVSLTYGDANTGKTFVDLDLALHIAYGMYWQGRKIESSRVLYIYGEGNEGLANRVEAWQKYHNKPDTDNIQFICFPVQLMSELEILCATIEDMEEIPTLIVIDTFSVCAEGVSENDNVEVAKFIACASHIKRTYKTHIHIIHHAGKNGDYRGAAAFRGNVDTMILLSREDQDAPIIMNCRKQKDAPYFDDIRLQLEQVDLGLDQETGIPITSCVVVASNLSTQAEDKAETERQKMLGILSQSERMNVNKWKEACSKVGISRNVFYAQKDYLANSGKVNEEKQGPGKPVFYSVPKSQQL